MDSAAFDQFRNDLLTKLIRISRISSILSKTSENFGKYPDLLSGDLLKDFLFAMSEVFSVISNQIGEVQKSIEELNV